MVVPRNDIYLNESPNDRLEVSIPWFVVEYPDCLVIIDGGNPVAVAADPVAYWGEPKPGIEVRMATNEACVATLRAQGFDVTRPIQIVQTHLHGDHVGALSAISELNVEEVFIARREYEYAINPDWHMNRSYAHKEFEAEEVPWRFIADNESALDVIGDGSVIMHHTPGHTPGHMSVEVNLPEKGTVIVTGDAAYTTAHWEDRALPGLLSSAVETVRSVRELRELAELRDALVVFGHDLDQWRKLDLTARSFS
jgi:N-acyl homoserine lactone hydrolase